MFVQVLILIIGFFLLVFGANMLVRGASNIAKKLHVPEILIGLTIVSIGTTLPELIVSITSALSGNTDLVLGNVVGSNMCNLLFILGIIIILRPIKMEKVTIKQNLPLLVLLTVIILIMGLGVFKNGNNSLNKIDGFVLLVVSLIYMSIPVIDFLKDNKTNVFSREVRKNKLFILKQIIYIVLGGVALKFGGNFAVDASIEIAKMLKISERVIGLTIVAVGTSLPELITSIVAILRGNEDIAEGNIIGACIINSCLVLGAGAIICNIPVSIIYIKDLIILLFSILLIWAFGIINKGNKLNRFNGAILFFIYTIYSLRLFLL